MHTSEEKSIHAIVTILTAILTRNRHKNVKHTLYKLNMVNIKLKDGTIMEMAFLIFVNEVTISCFISSVTQLKGNKVEIYEFIMK